MTTIYIARPQYIHENYVNIGRNNHRHVPRGLRHLVDTKSLVICLTFYDYKNVQHHTYAIIEKDEAMAMSEHLDVKLTDLPQTICKHCGDTSYVFVPSHVEELFKDVLDFILDCGAHYRISRD